MKGYSLAITVLLINFFTIDVFAQDTGGRSSGRSSNEIVTAVPFLSVSPDSRSGALGDAGVAISPDANALYWNPSKIAFLDHGGLSVSYSPWLRSQVPNVFLSYGSYVQPLDQHSAFGASFRYFNLGSVDLYDNERNSQGSIRPYEFSVDGSYARSFGENFSAGLSLRYIYSSLEGTVTNQGAYSQGNKVFAADASFYFKKNTLIFGKESLFAIGLNISNIGSRISYNQDGKKYFLPTNLKLGTANTWFTDGYSAITLAFDINKLLVPTPPIRDAENRIIKGHDDDKTLVEGIFKSFGDAPGGLKEELDEISFSTGLEYCYDNRFALRAGYFYENPNKGNKGYFTLGTGFCYRQLNLDFCYLQASQQKSPLANTIRISLGYNLKTRSNFH
ncbi:type IX secretion system outer membrane channel protein PorV [Pedobacter miscanthi]|uniref:Type IX secretion system protein PorV domain-containing protein n=1 Tax=Pedobacter miscanthi TaxID=2259170 RepID=A0A366L1W8_9SPHI|nr:type IX secretion system outer membrane channel protein PorV [Pedobacter miscanthi]RBQ07867.1 hypothetical protein DRW42_09705 [Pedobacter miscanthi]